MRYNRLGRTGLFVSELCLGTMTFGGGGGFWSDRRARAGRGRPDRRPLAGRGRQLHRHRRRLFVRPVREPARPVAEEPERPARGRGDRHQGLRRDGRRAPTTAAPRAATSWTRARQPEAAADRPHRPLPDPRHRPDHAGRGDPARARRPRAPGPGALHRRVEPAGLADGQGAGRQRAPGLARFETDAGLLLDRRARPGARDRAADDEEQVGLLVWSPLAGGLLSGKFGPGPQRPENARRASFDFPPVDKDRAWACVAAMREIATRTACRWRAWPSPGCWPSPGPPA